MSEFGGNDHIIQPDIDRAPADAAAVGLGHASDEARAADRRGVRDAAMVVRRAGMKEGQGVLADVIRDQDGLVTELVHYDEARAREDYVTGNND